MEPEPKDGQAELQVLARGIEAFSKGPGDTGAADLRSHAGILARQPKPSMAGGPKGGADASDPGLNAAREVVRAYRTRSPIGIGKLMRHGNLLDVFVGDRELGDWPFHHPELISEGDAANWLDWLARPDCRAVVDDDLMQFVRVFFRTRRRGTWIPASRALARMATSEMRAAQEVRTLWSQWRPGAKAVQTADEPPTTEDGDDDQAIMAHLDRANARHLERHVIHLACAWTALGGPSADLEGFDPDDPTRHLAASRDPSDLSAALEGVLELVAANRLPPDAWQGLACRVANSTQEAQTDHALRRLHDLLVKTPECTPAAATIRERLVRPDWAPGRDGLKERTLGHPTHWEMLWTWLETARWFQEKGDQDALQRMQSVAHANGAGPAFDLAVGARLPDGASDALAAALPRLRAMLDPDLWATTVGMRRTVLVVESWHLVHHPDIATLPWDAMAGRALGRPARSLEACDTLDKGLSVVEGWRSHLVMGMAQMGAGFLVRDDEFPESVVATMAWKGNGLEIQAAVQTERLLRQSSNAAQRVRCLWRILKQDPVQKFFTQLETVVRWNDAALVRLVRAVGEMDARRDASRNRKTILASEYPSLADLYGRVSERVAEVLGSQAPDGAGADATPARWLDGVREALNDTQASRDPGCMAWDHWLRTLLLGGGADGGLCDWTDWLALGGPGDAGKRPASTLRAEVERFLPPFAESLARLRDERFQITEKDIVHARRGLATLDDFAARMAWPEAAILCGAQAQLEDWLVRQEARVATSVRGEELGHRLRQLIAQGREDGVLGLLEGEDAALVDAIPDSARLEAHRFLLEKLNLPAAYRLRKRFSADSRFKPVYAHFSPLLAGVLGGPLLVLDFGTHWNDAFKNGAATETVLLTVAAMLLAFLMMWGSLRPRRPRVIDGAPPPCRTSAAVPAAGPGPWRLMLRAFGRLVAMFASAWALAALSTGLILLTLRTTDIAKGLTLPQQVLQVFLWSGLSLFMGMFFQIVMEQRTATRDD